MEPQVKEFIENNIQYIDNEDWELLLTAWYDESPRSLQAPKLYEELLDIFSSSGVHIKNIDVITRNILKKKLIDKIQSKRLQGSKIVTGAVLIQSLNFRFKLPAADLFSILDEVANQLKLTPNKNLNIRQYTLQ